MIAENVMISFLKKFDENPFLIKFKGKEYQVGEGTPLFTVVFHKEIPLSALTASTSLALGEAYMNGDLEVEGDLYFALDHFMGQMGSFDVDESALKKLCTVQPAKRTSGKRSRAITISAMISISCGWTGL